MAATKQYTTMAITPGTLSTTGSAPSAQTSRPFFDPCQVKLFGFGPGEWFLSFSLGPKRLSAQSNGIDSLRELTTLASRLNLLTRMFRRPVKSFTGRSKFDRFSSRDLRKLAGLKTVSRRRRVCWPGSLRERRPDISASCFSGRGSSAGRRRERPAPLLLCGIFHPCHRRKA